MINLLKVYIGVDISKNHLDIHVYPLGKHLKVKNSEYEKLLARALQGKEYKLWIINPRRIKGFIIASGDRSKTDNIDAQKIAEFVSKTPQEYKAISKTQIEENLQALVNRKNDLIKFLGTETTRLQLKPCCSYQGKKFIKGGRTTPRTILYMRALTTIKYNLILKHFYDRCGPHGAHFKRVP